MFVVISAGRNTLRSATDPPDSDLRSLHVQEPGFQSADGKWTAMVSKYIYAREEVILISQQ